MPSLSVRRLDQVTYEQLQIRAANEGVSLEEEVRRILKRAVAAPEKLTDLAHELFGHEFGVVLDLPNREPHEPLDLSS